MKRLYHVTLKFSEQIPRMYFFHRIAPTNDNSIIDKKYFYDKLGKQFICKLYSIGNVSKYMKMYNWKLPNSVNC